MKYLVLLLILSGCAFENKNPNPREYYAELQGSWTSSCFAQGEGYKIQKMTFNEFAVSVEEKVFSDDQCTQFIYLLQTQANYSIGFDADNILPKSVQIVYRMGDVFLTVKDLNASTDFNTETRCGFNDWVVDVPKIVNGLTCIPNDKVMPTKGYNYLNLIKIEAGQLYQGDDRCELDNSCIKVYNQNYPSKFYNFVLIKN